MKKLKKVAIIDDDETMLKLMDIIIKDMGYEVIAINEPIKADKIIRNEKPNLILLDLIMPDKDGSQVFYDIKGSSITKDIPVILLSASHKLEKVARDLKVQGYIHKPFNIEDLEETITKYIQFSY